MTIPNVADLFLLLACAIPVNVTGTPRMENESSPASFPSASKSPSPINSAHQRGTAVAPAKEPRPILFDAPALPAHENLLR